MRQARWLAAGLAAAAMAIPATGAIVTEATPKPVTASGVVQLDKGAVRYDFKAVGPKATIRFRRVSGGGSEKFFVDDPESILVLLADRRFESLWPALIEWAGPSLDRLRTIELDEARRLYESDRTEAPASSVESSVRPPARRLLRYTDRLATFGYGEAATTLLRAELQKRAALASDWDRVEYVMIALRLATLSMANGDSQAADAVYVEAGRALGDDPYAINLTINRAMLAVRTGRYAEGLTLIDRAQAAFSDAEGGREGAGHEKVPGSLRQFGWVRACALNGVGRTAEAQAILSLIATAEEPSDAKFVMSSNTSITIGAALCMHDAKTVADTLLTGITQADYTPGAALWLQHAYRRPSLDRATLARAQADPRLAAAVSPWMRQLPDSFDAALRQWRAAD